MRAGRGLGVVRASHALSDVEVTPALHAAAAHVHVSRRDDDKGPIDDALAALGLKRQIATTAGGYSAALAMSRRSDMVATVHERHTGILFAGMFSFTLPLPLAQFTVSLLWHPRLKADPANRWLRGCVREVCAGPLRAQAAPWRPSEFRIPAPASNLDSALVANTGGRFAAPAWSWSQTVRSFRSLGRH